MKIYGESRMTRTELKIALATALALVLTLQTASALCACSRPGAPGKLVGFTCRDGTTDNVSLYIPAAENSPKPGSTIFISARKDMDGTLVPINNLSILVTVDSNEFQKLATDEDGFASFTASEPGNYTVAGGDASYSFEVISPSVPQEPADVGQAEVPEEPNGAIIAQLDEGSREDVAPSDETTAPTERQLSNRDVNSREGMDMLAYAAAIILSASIAVFVLRRAVNNKKKGMRKK